MAAIIYVSQANVSFSDQELHELANKASTRNLD